MLAPRLPVDALRAVAFLAAGLREPVFALAFAAPFRVLVFALAFVPALRFAGAFALVAFLAVVALREPVFALAFAAPFRVPVFALAFVALVFDAALAFVDFADAFALAFDVAFAFDVFAAAFALVVALDLVVAFAFDDLALDDALVAPRRSAMLLFLPVSRPSWGEDYAMPNVAVTIA